MRRKTIFGLALGGRLGREGWGVGAWTGGGSSFLGGCLRQVMLRVKWGGNGWWWGGGLWGAIFQLVLLDMDHNLRIYLIHSLCPIQVQINGISPEKTNNNNNPAYK